MSHLLYLVTSVFLLAQQNGPAGIPVIEAGREVEIQELFSEVGAGELTGWSTPDIDVPYDRIRATFLGPQGERIVIEFRFPSGDTAAVAGTPSFEAFVVKTSGIEPDRADTVSKALVVSVSRRDDGSFWRRRAGSPTDPTAAVFAGGWFSSTGSIATVTWLLVMIVFLALVVGVVVRRKPWKDSESLRAMVEMAILVVMAFVIRQFLVDHGPGQQITYLVIPSAPPIDFPQFGPGYGGWMLGWFILLGSTDSVAFFAGALAGALTVIPAYILGWLGGSRRAFGIAAGAAIALWPIHARLSPTDDPASLIGLLVISSLALVFAARHTGSGALLIGAWLAGALAATIRPEPVLSLLPLAGLVVLMPDLRRLQMRFLVLVITAVMLAVTGLVVVAAVMEAMTNYSPTSSLTLEAAGRLLGLHGGSVLFPPRTPLLLGLLFLAGFGYMLYRTRGRALLWLCLGLFPAVPTARFAAPDIITARYQFALIPVGAVFAGIGVVWLGTLLAKRFQRARRFLLPAAAAIPIFFACLPLAAPSPEPTFRLEYDFFRKNIEKIPPDCRIIHITWWHTDLGLRVPVHLSRLLNLKHSWIPPSADLDAESGCLVYWQPSSCRAVAPEMRSASGSIMRDCETIETSYRLEAIAKTSLPARTGFCETYQVDPVPVGFYRLRSQQRDLDEGKDRDSLPP